MDDLDGMDEFAITVTGLDAGRTVVGVCGDLDLDTADRLWAEMAPLLVPDAVVVLDAALMPFTDSSGLRVLLQLARRAKETGAAFRLAALRMAVERVIEISGVLAQLTVRDDVAGALAG